MQLTPKKIVYVTPFMPHSRTCGADVRSFQILTALRQIGAVDIVVLTEEEHRGLETDEASGGSSRLHVIQTMQMPKRRISEKVSWTFLPSSQYPNGYRIQPEAERYLLQRFEQSDLVWFFRLRCPDMLAASYYSNAVLDIDDVPSQYERSRMGASRGVISRIAAYRRLFVWKRRELLLEKRFNALTVCTDEDLRYLRDRGITKPIEVIPNGFTRPESTPKRTPRKPGRLGFIGLFDHSKDICPNIDGIRWFVTHCWPDIKRSSPELRLRLVGKGGGQLNLEGDDIDVLGWLSDPEEEIATWNAMIVPIRVGGGTRVKVAQGFSLRCPVVATPLGAHGYNARDGENMYLAASAEAFSAACIRLVREPEVACQMADKAWNEFLAKWTWEAIYPRVWNVAEECLRRSYRAPGSSTRQRAL